MDESNNSGVTAGAPPAAESSPASAPADTGGQGAIGGGEPSTGTPGQAAPAAAVAGNESGADAGVEEWQPPVTEEELQQAPEQWRNKFGSLLTGYKSLDTDHRELKGKYQAYSDLGEAEEIKAQQELLDGLYGYAQDENGETLYDENGMPMASTMGFVSRIQEGSPALAQRLFLDLWSVKGVDGQTGAQRMFKALGLDPTRLNDYRALTQNPNRTVATPSGAISADELSYIPENRHDTYKLLSPTDRYKAQQIEDPQELDDFLAEKEELFENRQFRQDYNRSLEERAVREGEEFKAGVERSFAEYSGQLRQEGLGSIIKNLASQVQFSADPTTNAVQTGAVMSIMANLLHPDLRFATQSTLQALGVTLDQSFYDSLQALSDQAQAVKWYEAVGSNPTYAQYRNDAALGKARGEVKRLYDSAMAKFNGIALKVAKVIAGGNQELREVERSKLGAPARPVIGNGAVPGGSPVRTTAKPFTVEWLQQNGQGQ